MDKGSITTYTTTAVMLLAAYYGVSTVTANFILQTILIFGAIGLAILNLYYPRAIQSIEEQLNEIQDLINELQKQIK